MSARAIRALRDRQLQQQLQQQDDDAIHDEEDDDDDDDDDDIVIVKRPTTAFNLLHDDDDDDDDDSEEEDDDDVEEIKVEVNETPKDREKTSSKRVGEPTSKAAAASTSKKMPFNSNDNDDVEKDDDDDDDDIDDILLEFQQQKLQQDDHTNSNNNDDDGTNNNNYIRSVLSFDVRDLDYQYTMRTSIVTNNNNNNNNTKSGCMKSITNSNNKQCYIFGSPNEEWTNVRPPRYIGGGIGMISYYSNNSTATTTPAAATTDTNNTKKEKNMEIPWPYNIDITNHMLQNTNDDESRINDSSSSSMLKMISIYNNPKYWYMYQRSDISQRELQDYNSIVQQNGDMNILLMFIAHHPYVPEALLQCSKVLYQMNIQNNYEGLLMLRRCLYMYESVTISSFIQRIIHGQTIYMDIYHKDNTCFFHALFRMIQVSYIAGLHRTALASCRLLLSLDPLRDPMNVLLIMDYHTIVVSRGYNYNHQIRLLQWLIDFVDQNIVSIWYQDSNDTHQPNKAYYCSVLDLPNWSYTYALALFDLSKAMEFVETDHDDDDNNNCNTIDDIKQKADTAIQNAMHRYPSIVGYLLHHLEIDTTGRSFQRDWVTVLDYATTHSRQLVRYWHNNVPDTFVLSASLNVCDLISKIFVEQNAKLYGDEDVLQWMYDNLTVLKNNKTDMENGIGTITMPNPPNPAILRYANVDPADYRNKVEQLPPDANIIDNGILAHAMTLDSRRPRYLRRNQNQQRRRNNNNDDDFDDDDDIHYDELGNPILPQQHRTASYFGPPTEVVDPDWPMAEVFLRSILPWNYVEGLPPPRR